MKKEGISIMPQEKKRHTLYGRLLILKDPDSQEIAEMYTEYDGMVCILAASPGSGHTMILLPSNLVIRGRKAEKVINGYALGFSPKYLEELDLGYRKQYFRLSKTRAIAKETSEEWAGSFISSINAIIQWTPPDHGKSHDEKSRDYLIHSLVLMIFDQFDISDKLQKFSTKERIMTGFLRMLHEDRPIQRELRYYADRLCITTKYLSSVVSRCSGKRAHQWIDEFIIAVAKIELQNSMKPVKVLADELNFDDSAAFCRYFKNRVGLTPKQFRYLD